MTHAQAIQQIIINLQNGSADIQTDNQGQLIVYSNLFVQVDDTVEEFQDESFDPNT